MERPLVLVVGNSLEKAIAGVPQLNAELESEYGRALDLLVSGPHDVGVVACELGGGVQGIDLIREAVSRGSSVPLILVTDGLEGREAALEAGAAGCVDLKDGPAAIGWSVAFARSMRISADHRNARVLKDVSSFLAHEGKNVLAAIGGAVEVLSHGMPQNGPDWTICQEIRARLGAFRDTIDAMTLAVRLRTPLRENGASREAFAGKTPPAPQLSRKPSPPVAVRAVEPEPARTRRGTRAKRPPPSSGA